MADNPPSTDANAGQATPSAALDVRAVALIVLATIAVLFMLHWGRSVFIPVTLALFLSYALSPAVNWLHRRAKLPCPLSAAFILVSFVTVLGTGVAALHDQAMEMLDTLPKAAQKLERAIRQNVVNQEGTFSKLKKAAVEIEKAANSATVPGPARTPPVAAPPPSVPQLTTYLWSGSLEIAVGLGQAAVIVMLTYFLLIAGDSFKRKIVRISGETLTEKKVTVGILQEIDEQIQRYLLVQVVASAVYGVLIGVALWLMGLENALFWGLLAGILHLIPYVGPVAVVALTTIVAFLQFSDPTSVLILLAVTTGITTLIGFGLLPWLTERTSRLNAVTVFVTLLFWGWLWGIWGLLLGVPIVMALHATLVHITSMQPIADLLGQEAEPGK